MIYISLGWNCGPAIIRKNIFKQYKKVGYNTQPFDLCVTPYIGICECLSDDFNKFFDLRIENGIIMNSYNMWFNHECPIELYTDNDFKRFKEKYTNRINNFRKYLEGDNQLYFIHSNPFEDSMKLCSIIENKYPKLIFKILSLKYNDIDLYKKHFSYSSDCETHAEMGKYINVNNITSDSVYDKIICINNESELVEYVDFNIYKNKYGKFYTPKGLDKGIDWVLRNGYVHEEETLLFISKIINKGSIITAGTHIGSFLPFYSEIAETVYGFEPEPENYRFAMCNVIFNNLNNVILQNIALGEKNCIKCLKNKNLIEKSLSRIVDNYDIDCINVPTKTLDSLFSKENIYNISVIQLDVEGYEENVLNGAIQIIKKYKPIIIYEKCGELNINVPNVLAQFGYVCLNRKINDNQIAYLPQYHNNLFSSDNSSLIH